MNYLIALLCLSLTSFATATALHAAPATPAANLGYTIIAERHHDKNLFTQGLLIYDDRFYESSGRYEESTLVSYPVVEAKTKITNATTQKKSVPSQYFAEGLTRFDNKLYQLTWKEGTLLVYDATTLQAIGALKYKGEGWGLAATETQLIRSDGSDILFFHNPTDFTVEKTISVRLNQTPIGNLNELEFIDGFIWSNVWQDNRILKINPSTGDVVGVLDLSALVKRMQLRDPESVLNGIAYDADKKALWVTGKYWPTLFLVKTH